MGQKANPMSLRLSLHKNWTSRWFSHRNMADRLIEDSQIRGMIVKLLGTNAGIGQVIIKRGNDDVIVDIHSSKPGVIIGRGGKGIDLVSKAIKKLVNQDVKVNIIEIRKPDLNAMVVAQNISYQISKRLPYRRAVKQAMEKSTEAGAKGIKIQIAGRLNGAEIARKEKFSVGSIPTSTLKAKIDYASVHAPTTYGIIGIKVWIYTGFMSTVEEDM